MTKRNRIRHSFRQMNKKFETRVFNRARENIFYSVDRKIDNEKIENRKRKFYFKLYINLFLLIF